MLIWLHLFSRLGRPKAPSCIPWVHPLWACVATQGYAHTGTCKQTSQQWEIATLCSYMH